MSDSKVTSNTDDVTVHTG